MDFILNRYRNLTVLLVVIVAQLLLLAYQVKTNKDVPLMRVWAVSTITPVEQALEFVRRHTFGLADDYFVLVHVREENDKLQRDMDKLKLENHYLRSQLATADRAQQLNAFRQETPSKTLAARAIGNGTGTNSKTIFVDRGSSAGVQNGMAVITPDGIIGKIVAAYPTASLVMLVTDASFAAGVISQKNHVHGTLKGQGGPKCRVDYVQNEEKVEVGEWFYTSGDDGIFPRGFPVGQVASVRNGRTAKEIVVAPSGWQGGVDEVLIVIEGIHQQIPEQKIAAAPPKILPPPADQSNTGSTQSTAALITDADKLRQEYKQIGEQEKIQYGASGSKPPDFSKIGKSATPPPAQGQAQQGQPPAPPTGNPGAAPVTAGKPPVTTPPGTGTAVPAAVAPAGTTLSRVPGPNPTGPMTATNPAAPRNGANSGAGTPGTSTSAAGRTAAPNTGQPAGTTVSRPPGGGATGQVTATNPAPLRNAASTGAPAGTPAARPPSTNPTGQVTATNPPAQRNAASPGAPPGGTTASRPPATQPGGTGTAPTLKPAAVTNARSVERSTGTSTQATAPPAAKPRKAPILETDPIDADPAHEAVVERIQRERSNKVASDDKNTEILPPAPAPRPKTVPPKASTPATGSGRTGPGTP